MRQNYLTARCRPTNEHELTAAKFKLAGSLALLAVLCALSLLTGCVKREPEPSVEDQVQQLEKRVQQLEARANECKGAQS